MRRGFAVAMECTIACAAALLTSCRSTTAPALPGVIIVTSTVALASDGRPFTYRIAVDSLPLITLSTDDIENTFRVGPLKRGDHIVALLQLATACTSGNDSRHVAVGSGDTVRVTFDVHCARTTGDLSVITTTTGSDLDPDGYLLTVDSTIVRAVARNGARTFARLTPGTHVVKVSDVEDNCSVIGNSSQQVTISAAQTTALALTLTCAPVPYGTLAFSVADPAADTLPNASNAATPAIDLVRLDGRYTPGWFFLVLHFSAPVIPAATLLPGALHGFIDLDIDESPVTGADAGINRYGGNVNQGVDYEISFASGISDPTVAAILDLQGVFGYVASTYAGDSLVLRVPLSKIGGDDGNFTLTAVIGTSDRPTDILPNAGVVVARAPAGMASQRVSASLTTRVRPAPGTTRGTSRAGARAWDGR